MTSMETKSNGWRGSEDLWLDAAYDMLVDTGVESVKVMPLAKTLKMSRTSFYWHFEDRDALLDALIRRWRGKNTDNLIAQTERYAETVTEAMFNLFDCWIEPDLFDARLDFAIRNWANRSPKLKAILEASDRQRIDAIRAMFARFGFDAEQASTRAHTVYYTQVGYIAMMIDEPLPTRLGRMPTYIETYTGQHPTDSEIARFMDRHKEKL